MKKVVVLGVMMCCFAFAKAYAAPSFMQELVSHQVKQGETIYGISKAYGISEAEIYKLNPDAKARIYKGLLLILPSTAQSVPVTTTAAQDDLKFKNHKVKRKETLYSLSKTYGIPVEVIKKYNKQLYNQTLRKGDKIKIPINYKEQIEATPPALPSVTETIPVEEEVAAIVETTPLSNTITYTVKAKETKYSISKKYGITIPQLEKMNPDMGVFLTEGAEIQLPVIKNEEGQLAVKKPQFDSYEVKKGNTIYSLLKQFNMKAEDLIALNPSLTNGLREGMILKVPIAGAKWEGISENKNSAYLKDSISNYSVKNIAVMLPFGVKRADIDTVGVRTNMLKNDRVLRLSLDFHSGILMAVKDAEKIGITANITVYDTEYDRKDGKAANARKVENIIIENNFSEVDAVIGPLLGGNVDRAASLLITKNIPVISPVTQRISGGPNVFQSRPSDDNLREKMFEYLETQDKEQNVVIIADFKNSAAKSRLKQIFPNAKEIFPREGDNGLFLNSNDIPSKVLRTMPNLIILETTDIPMISQVTTDLNTLASGIVGENFVTKYDITLVTTHKGKAYESDAIQHEHLMNLNFHFPSIAKECDSSSNSFVNAYESKYGVTPSTEAIRGYDITMDTLLRLGYGGDLYEAASTEIETQYVENKFNYKKTANGFYNNATYIIKYEEELLLKEVTIMKVMDDKVGE